MQEIAFLQKFMHILLNTFKEAKNPAERLALRCQASHLLRLLASTVYEAWNAVTHRKHMATLGWYRTHLKEGASLLSVERYFRDHNNLCTNVRNNFMYHYNYGTIAKTVAQWPREHPLNVLLIGEGVNVFSPAADTVGMLGMSASFDDTEIPAQVESTIKEIIQVSGWMLGTLADMIRQLLDKVGDSDILRRESIKIEDAPSLRNIRLPALVEAT